MKKFFEVQAKCGHVGRGHFFKGTFYINAHSASEAAAVVRNMPRVKHDRKDAIISVNEISKRQFEKGREERSENPYYSCVNVQEQRANIDKISIFIEEEDRFEPNLQEMKEKRQARILRNKIKNEWQQKYAKQEIAYAY